MTKKTLDRDVDGLTLLERTWTAKEVARAFNITPGYLKRLARRIARELDPPRYGRNGRHWRKHRWFTEREIALLSAARKTPATNPVK